MAENAIVVKDLHKSFKDNHVLDGINLTVKKGEILALLGPNGAGKTTTVRILTTLLRPDSGDIKVNGFDVTTQADNVREVIGLTGQYAAVDEYLNAKQNLVMMGRLYHLSQADSERRATELLEAFDLVDASKRPVKTFSGGMRRRLDLALSLVATPPIIFLDEPTTGLDPRSRLMVWDTVKQLAESGATILLTTQYLEEADQLADRVAVIDGGKVIAEGTPDELKQQVGKERIEFTIDKNADFEKAAKLITGESVKANKNDRTISLATDGTTHELKDLLTKLDDAKIDIETFSLHKPTLDDVFLQFTGHQATQQTEEGAPDAK